MTKIKKNLASFLTLALFFIMALACNTSKMTFGNGKKWIPEDFDPNKTTLLVEEFTVSENANQKMQEYMQEKYPYKYEFVSREAIENRKGTTVS